MNLKLLQLRQSLAPLFLAFLLSTGALGTAAWAGEVKRFELTIAERALASGEATLKVNEGDEVALAWQSDEAVELHLHGYDVEIALAPGTSGVMAVTATVSGRFPISSHGFGGDHDYGEQVLAYLEVYPN